MPSSQLSQEPIPVAIRPAEAGDEGFLYRTWLEGHRVGSPAFGLRIRKTAYFKLHHPLVERILSRSRIWIACSYSDPDVIAGYIVAEPPGVLHWVFIREGFKRMGLMRLLITAAGLPSNLEGVEFSHDSADYYRHLRSRFPKAIFNPYRVG
jgi:hypothetical protein